LEYERFEWDDAKAGRNGRSHGVTFDEGSTVFDDPNVFIVFDTEHSQDEDRRTAVGFSSKGRLLAVSYTIRGARIRLISARKATLREKRDYGKGQA